MRLNTPNVTSPNPHFVFLNAVENILPHFYTVNQNIILKQAQSGYVMNFPDLLNLFRNVKLTHQAKQGRILSGKSTFTTSFQGRKLGDDLNEEKPTEFDPKSQNKVKSYRSRLVPKCLCGKVH
jgi:hypothetical protein